MGYGHPTIGLSYNGHALNYSMEGCSSDLIGKELAFWRQYVWSWICSTRVSGDTDCDRGKGWKWQFLHNLCVFWEVFSWTRANTTWTNDPFWRHPKSGLWGDKHRPPVCWESVCTSAWNSIRSRSKLFVAWMAWPGNKWTYVDIRCGPHLWVIDVIVPFRWSIAPAASAGGWHGTGILEMIPRPWFAAVASGAVRMRTDRDGSSFFNLRGGKLKKTKIPLIPFSASKTKRCENSENHGLWLAMYHESVDPASAYQS